MESTIYTEEITEITNAISECSRIAEGIEGKVVMITDDTPEESDNNEGKVVQGRPRRGCTMLADRLAEVLATAEALMHRLKRIEDRIVL